MGGVSIACQEPGGASAGTVEPRATATRSYSFSIDTPPEVGLTQKPEVVCEPVIVQQPSALVPFSQIRAGEGNLFLTSVESLKEPDNRSTAVGLAMTSSIFLFPVLGWNGR